MIISLLLPIVALSAAAPVVITDAELEKQAVACGMSTQIPWRGGSKTPDVRLDQRTRELDLRMWQGNKENRDCMEKWGHSHGLTVVHWQD